MTDLSQWPAIVLAAGRATRLRPLSLVRAKAAMPVAGQTIIERILRWLQAAGVHDVIINLHHRPETITAIVGDGSQFGVRVRYSWERTLLGSAGGPRRAMALGDADRYLIVNGDTLTDCDLQATAERHLMTGAAVTMAVVSGDTSRYGGVLVDERDVVHGFGRARSPWRSRHFIGVQTVEANVFAALPDDQPNETVGSLYPSLLAARPGAIRTFDSDAEFLDVGTARDYLTTVAAVAAREGRAFDRGADVNIAADASLERTIVWDHVAIGAGASLIDCVVADGVVVPEDASYRHTVLVPQIHSTDAAASLYAVAL